VGEPACRTRRHACCRRHACGCGESCSTLTPVPWRMDAVSTKAMCPNRCRLLPHPRRPRESPHPRGKPLAANAAARCGACSAAAATRYPQAPADGAIAQRLAHTCLTSEQPRGGETRQDHLPDRAGFDASCHPSAGDRQPRRGDRARVLHASRTTVVLLAAKGHDDFGPGGVESPVLRSRTGRGRPVARRTGKPMTAHPIPLAERRQSPLP